MDISPNRQQRCSIGHFFSADKLGTADDNDHTIRFRCTGRNSKAQSFWGHSINLSRFDVRPYVHDSF